MKTISYSSAIKTFGNSFIRCNNVCEIDPEMWENMYGNFYQEDGETLIDIYQYCITDCTAEDVRYLSEWFDLPFLYSDALDCFVLCVTHWGTSWDSVMIEDKSDLTRV